MPSGKKANDWIEEVHDYWIDERARQLWLHGRNALGGEEEGEPGVEYMMSTRFIKNLHILRVKDEHAPVTVHLHTCGGDYQEGMAIYDALKVMPFHITMICYTHARSMSSIIFQAADERLMLLHSYFMFHYGTISFSEQYEKLVEADMEYAKAARETMLDIYVESAAGSEKFKHYQRGSIREQLRDLMDKKGNVFLTPSEAIEWGFADAILDKWPLKSNSPH